MKWVRTEYHDEISEYKCVDFSYYNYPYVYALCFVSDTDSYDKCLKEFEEVFDSFVITE